MSTRLARYTTLLLFLCLLMQAIHVDAQTFNRAHQNLGNYSGNAIIINQRVYFLEISYKTTGFRTETANLVSMDFGGNILFRSPFFHETDIEKSELLIKVTPENNILVSCGTRLKGCDYGFSDYRIGLFDTLGNSLWSMNLTEPVKSLAIHPDKRYSWFGENNIYQLDTTPQQIGSVAVHGMVVNDGVPVAGGSYLAGGAAAGGKGVIQQIDKFGSVTYSVELPNAVDRVLISDKKFVYALSGGLLYRLDTMLNITDCSSVTLNQQFDVIQFTNAWNRIHCIGVMQGQLTYAELLNDLQVNYISQSTPVQNNLRK